MGRRQRSRPNAKRGPAPARNRPAVQAGLRPRQRTWPVAQQQNGWPTRIARTRGPGTGRLAGPAVQAQCAVTVLHEPP